MIDTQLRLAVWNLLLPSGSPDAPSERQRFATVMIRNSLVLYGGQSGGSVPLDDVFLVDLCKTGGCSLGSDSTCDVYTDERGQCTKCQGDTMCCNEASLPASTGGLCSGLDMTLTTCTTDTSLWASLMGAMLPQNVGPQAPSYIQYQTPKINFGNSYAECTANIQSMCQEASSYGAVRAMPLLCSVPFMCAKRSPLMSAQISSLGLCGLEGATCPKQGSPNNVMCCTYLEYVVNASCSGLNYDQLTGLATSKFTECSTQSDCIMPPLFQVNDAHVTISLKQPESLHMAATAAVRQAVYVLGGFSAAGMYLDTFWKLDLSSYPPTWKDMSSLRGCPAGGRRGAAMTAIQAIIIMTGGEGPQFLSDDAFMFDTDTAIWTDITFAAEGDKPTARYQHAMVSVGGTKAYLFGGETLSGKANDLYGKCIRSP
jgi:hypothetical protein